MAKQSHIYGVHVNLVSGVQSLTVCSWGVFVFTGLDYWTGLLDWTTGLTFELAVTKTRTGLELDWSNFANTSRLMQARAYSDEI